MVKGILIIWSQIDPTWAKIPTYAMQANQPRIRPVYDFIHQAWTNKAQLASRLKTARRTFDRSRCEPAFPRLEKVFGPVPEVVEPKSKPEQEEEKETQSQKMSTPAKPTTKPPIISPGISTRSKRITKKVLKRSAFEALVESSTKNASKIEDEIRETKKKLEALEKQKKFSQLDVIPLNDSMYTELSFSGESSE